MPVAKFLLNHKGFNHKKNVENVSCHWKNSWGWCSWKFLVSKNFVHKGGRYHNFCKYFFCLWNTWKGVSQGRSWIFFVAEKTREGGPPGVWKFLVSKNFIHKGGYHEFWTNFFLIVPKIFVVSRILDEFFSHSAENFRRKQLLMFVKKLVKKVDN